MNNFEDHLGNQNSSMSDSWLSQNPNLSEINLMSADLMFEIAQQ